MTVLQDITEVKQLSQLKTEFVATVSHDLRSPLTSIRGFVDLLGVAGPLTEAQRIMLDTAADRAAVEEIDGIEVTAEADILAVAGTDIVNRAVDAEADMSGDQVARLLGVGLPHLLPPAEGTGTDEVLCQVLHVSPAG
mgnify:CR=1 FL=1